ncbi:hypothetical protein YC2023_026775 [Brassica napus]
MPYAWGEEAHTCEGSHMGRTTTMVHVAGHVWDPTQTPVERFTAWMNELQTEHSYFFNSIHLLCFNVDNATTMILIQLSTIYVTVVNYITLSSKLDHIK